MNTQVILEDFKWENFAIHYDYVYLYSIQVYWNDEKVDFIYLEHYYLFIHLFLVHSIFWHFLVHVSDIASLYERISKHLASKCISFKSSTT